jgi:putative CocE/NonD family hydrolase
MLEKAGTGSVDWDEFFTRELADPYWTEIGYISDEDRFDVPALHVNSWYDLGVGETLYLFNLMQRNAESERAKANQFAIISPSPHCASESMGRNATVGDLPVGDARLDYMRIYLDWFDHWLKGIENGVTEMPRLQLYVIGRNEWIGAAEWPLAGTVFTDFYLHSGGTANSRRGDGALSRTPPGNEPPDRFTYDPSDPVPSQGGSLCCTGNPADQPGSFDQSDIEEREDVLVYTSEPLEEPLQVVGPLSAILYVSSSARDTDFTVKLLDVYPDGRAFNVQEAILRARYRDGFDTRVWMEPDGIYELSLDLHATGYEFQPGHRIRVDVSSSNFPRFDRNLNTGGNNYDETEGVVAHNTVHHSRQYPSQIRLPVVKR